MSKLSDKILSLEYELAKEKAIVDTIWNILRTDQCEEIQWEQIYNLVKELKDKARENVLD